MAVKLYFTIKWLAALTLFLLFCFFYPRFLLSIWGPEHPWTNYLYLYGFGFFYTGSGVLLVLKNGACQLQRPRDRFWLKVVVGGFLYFAILHGVWIMLALNIPYKGEL
jgi:hypothetical protein